VTDPVDGLAWAVEAVDARQDDDHGRGAADRPQATDLPN